MTSKTNPTHGSPQGGAISPEVRLQRILAMIASRSRSRVRSLIMDKIADVVGQPGGHVTLLRVDQQATSQIGRWEAETTDGPSPASALDVFLAWLLQQLIELVPPGTNSEPIKARLRCWFSGGKAHGSCSFEVVPTDIRSIEAEIPLAEPVRVRPAPNTSVAPSPDLELASVTTAERSRLPVPVDDSHALRAELSAERAEHLRLERKLAVADAELDRVRQKLAMARHGAKRSSTQDQRRFEKFRRSEELRRRAEEDRRRLQRELDEALNERDRQMQSSQTLQGRINQLDGYCAQLGQKIDALRTDRDEWRDLAQKTVLDNAREAGLIPEEEDDDSLLNEDSYDSYDGDGVESDDLDEFDDVDDVDDFEDSYDS